jgi:phosphatidylglycerophosphatase A
VPLTAIGLAVGVYTAGRLADEEGDRLTRTAAAAKAAFQSGARAHPDPSIVVIDEIVGMWITLLWLSPGLLTYAIAFIAFRLLDVTKPEPARVFERLPGGWGIMLDDVVAGCYANLATRLALFLVSTLWGAGAAS